MGSVVISRHGVYVGASEAQYNLSPPGRQVRGIAATTQESANRFLPSHTPIEIAKKTTLKKELVVKTILYWDTVLCNMDKYMYINLVVSMSFVTCRIMRFLVLVVLSVNLSGCLQSTGGEVAALQQVKR